MSPLISTLPGRLTLSVTALLATFGFGYLYLRWSVEHGADLTEGMLLRFFTLATRSGSLPDITKTIAALGLKTFKYIEPILVQLQPSDQDKPTLETVIQTAPAQDRPGWLKVTAAHATTDGHDPYPEVLLTKIESNQYISSKDVEAVYGAETTTFYVKQKRGRTYTAFYKAVDASGNSVTRKTEFDASN